MIQPLLDAALSIAACTVCWACLVTGVNLTPLCHAMRLLHVADYYIVYCTCLLNTFIKMTTITCYCTIVLHQNIME